MLPRPVQQLAPLLPPYHAAELALWVVGHEAGPLPWVSAVYLAGLGLASFAVAAVAMRRQGGAK